MSLNRLAGIIQDFEGGLLSEWIGQQLRSLARRRDLISEPQLRANSHDFLLALRSVKMDGDIAGLTKPEWARLRDMLGDVSRQRAQQGFTPSETANFIFSFKQPLFERLRQQFANDPAALNEEVWTANQLLDALGLYTVEVPRGYYQPDGELSDEQEKQVRYIRKAAEALAEMVNDLLDLAKVEAGKTEIRAGYVDVSQVFGAVRALMRPLATKDAVTLVFDEPPAGLVIETDEAKLGQILRNLVSNALKFTEQGEVRVSCQLSDDRRSILFSVADTGIGIAPQYLERVFHEFAQVENPLQRTVKGAGLGLALSRKLARLLGGTLEVASRLGIGSTFTLTLPARFEATDSERPNMEMVRSETDAGKILIVDDEETARYLCRQLLRGTKYRIIEAENASEGAERARFERPALIVLDLMMPDRSGFDVLDELKADPATADIPVVIHTSKRLTDGDLERLAGRHAALLPKAQGTRAEALLRIRTLLGEPDLFSKEPEFLPQELGTL